jgi:hypothetical protein
MKMGRSRRTGSSSYQIKAHNQQAILLSLLQHGSLSRSALARRTALSATTISNQTANLLAQGYLREQSGRTPAAGQRGVGRPQTGLQIVPEAASVLGIHIGIGTIRAARHDLFGRVQEELVANFAPQDQADAVLTQAADLAEKLAGTGQPLLGVGVGVPGLVDPGSGRSLVAIGLNWQDVALWGTSWHGGCGCRCRWKTMCARWRWARRCSAKGGGAICRCLYTAVSASVRGLCAMGRSSAAAAAAPVKSGI